MNIDFYFILKYPTFQLPAIRGGGVYHMNKAVLSVSVQLLKKDGSAPADNSEVALGRLIIFLRE